MTAGVAPHMATVEQQSWESFSAPWNVDVRITFEVGRAALARPLSHGATVVIVASGAAVNPSGSPLSGGYAGAKRMQMFLAGYLQREADARELGIRFVALAPLQMLAGTRIGLTAAAAYGAAQGISAEEHLARNPAQLRPDDVARATAAIALDDPYPGATALGVDPNGLRPLGDVPQVSAR